jgi:hypothetical protein
MTIQEIDSVLTKIAVMDRLALLQQIRAFHDPFRLDFTDEYLAAQDCERLRHILMAAYLQQKSHAFELEPVG